MEGRSIVEDRRPRNSYHRVCYVFVARAASECHWNWTAMGDDQRPTEGDSRLRGTREPVQQATDAPTVEGASRARLLPRHIGDDFSFFFLGQTTNSIPLVWGRAVNSPSGVWGKAPADKRFGAYCSQKVQLWWQQFFLSF